MRIANAIEGRGEGGGGGVAFIQNNRSMVCVLFLLFLFSFFLKFSGWRVLKNLHPLSVLPFSLGVARIMPENSDYASSIKIDVKRISWNPGQFNLNIRFLPFVLATRRWNPGSATATDRNRKQHAYYYSYTIWEKSFIDQKCLWSQSDCEFAGHVTGAARRSLELSRAVTSPSHSSKRGKTKHAQVFVRL